MVDYKNIFNAAYNSLQAQSFFTPEKFKDSFSEFENMRLKTMSDDAIYKKMVQVVFYSGMRAETVTSKMNGIDRWFADFRIAKDYKDKDVKNILKDREILRNERKIHACIHNAKVFHDIISEYGSFNKLLKSFGNLDLDENSSHLIKYLRKSFKYLGKITVYHFLMDLGLNFVKPDRVLCRIFNRLNLIPSISSYDEVIQVGRKFAEVTGYLIRLIDIVFVFYGQEGQKINHGLKEGICLEKNPKCNICGMYEYCHA